MSLNKSLVLGSLDKVVYMKTGTYTGDAAATKAITGLGFKPKALLILRQTDNSSYGFWFATEQAANLTSFMDFVGAKVQYKADMIISLDVGGFTVGDGTGFGNILNAAVTYTYIAWG